MMLRPRLPGIVGPRPDSGRMGLGVRGCDDVGDLEAAKARGALEPGELVFMAGGPEHGIVCMIGGQATLKHEAQPDEVSTDRLNRLARAVSRMLNGIGVHG